MGLKPYSAPYYAFSLGKLPHLPVPQFAQKRDYKQYFLDIAVVELNKLIPIKQVYLPHK